MLPVSRTSAGAIKFAGHAIAFVLPIAQLPNLSDPDEFWSVYRQHGRLVDSLPNGSSETVAIFIDFLATEARIQIPSRWSTELGMRIMPPEDVTVWTCMSPHDAKVFRSRLPDPPGWTAELIGIDFFHGAVKVCLCTEDIESALPYLRQLPCLREVYVSSDSMDYDIPRRLWRYHRDR